MTAASSPTAPTMAAMAPRAIPPALEASKAVQGPLRQLDAAERRLAAAQVHFAETRRQVVADLLDAGLSYAQVASLIGVTKSRAYQIARGE